MHTASMTIFRSFLITMLALFVGSSASARGVGDDRFDLQVGTDRIVLYSYRPPHCAQPDLLLVFHGKGRKASKMRDRAKPIADAACLAVIAPLFDKETFPNWRYHRAGVIRKGTLQPRQTWTGPTIEAIVQRARRWIGDDDARYYLFGHSAGGQFLSRSAAYSPPTGAERIVIANPSVYVLPSLTEAIPFGFEGQVKPEHDLEDVRNYLGLPITVYIGSRDTGRKNLVVNDAAMRQGADRFERGQNVFELAKTIADDNDWLFGWRLVVAKGVGHSSKGMLSAPEAYDAFNLLHEKQESKAAH
jgi:hypothetical protein